MSWQSMFDGGACTVSVYWNGSAPPLWTGTLAKGGSSGAFSDGFGDTFSVDVDPAGVVTVSSPDDSVTVAQNLGLDVAPQYDASALATQIISIGVSPPGGAGNGGYANNQHLTAPPSGGGTAISVDPAGTVAPNFVPFGAMTGAVMSVSLGSPA